VGLCHRHLSPCTRSWQCPWSSTRLVKRLLFWLPS
jgi:hypothetical protein